MINYSIAMRSKPGAGSSGVKKAYAQAQYSSIMEFDEFCEHIASHGSVYSKADYLAVITQMVSCIKEMLLDGRRIQLGDLGVFSTTLRSEGAASAAEFTAANITKAAAHWTPSEEFTDLIKVAKFNLVSTRETAAKLMKAVKAGDNTVVLTPEESTDETGGSGTGA